MNLRTPLLIALIYLPAFSGISPSQTPAPPAWSFLEDADQDGMTDVNEILLGLDPLNPADGLSDLDWDGLSLSWEFAIATHASLADTDADGWSDSEEYLTHGTDPRDWLSFPVSSSSPSTAPPAAAPLPAPAAATPPPAPPPPPPSLSNGDFSVQTFSWRSGQTYKDYQGGGFDWGQGTVSGWSAYVGTTVEVWKSGSQTFVELDGTSTSHGIKQDITAVVPGHYVLAWKQCGRSNNLAGDNSYKVKIYYTPVASSAPVTISETAEFKAIDKTKWIDKAHGFQVSAAQIAAANGNITVAFIPTGTLNTYGTLIDKVNLVPVDLISDLNNDGQISAADNSLRDAAGASGATDEIKDKGTEFIFHNDTLSNGIWDKEDTDPAKPATVKDDDDAEEIRIKPGITEGEVWLDHPAITGLSFYKTRECKPADKVNLSPSIKFTITTTNPFPDKLYMRADDNNLKYPQANPQFAGDLVLKIKVGSSGEVTEALTMKLNTVKQLGAKKFFLAARDYIFENNTRLFVKDKKYSASIFRICVICEELSVLSPIEAYHDDPTPDPERKGPRGIMAAMSEYSEMTIITNGNMVYFSGGDTKWDALALLLLGAETSMTDKCQGGIVTKKNRRLNPASTEAGAVLGAGEGDLAKNDAKFIAQKSDGSFLFEKGHLPKNPLPDAAMGGLSTYYDNPERNGADRQFVGYWPRTDSGALRGCVFTATHTSGNSNVADFVDDARGSEVPAFEGTHLKLFMLDSGDAAVSLAHSGPDEKLKLADFQRPNILRMQASYQAGVPYFTNTFLAFKTTKPR